MLKINPLVDIEVSFPDPAGGFVHRYLGFSFRRIVEDGRVTRVFVAVRDITAQIELEKRLREAEKLKERQMEILLGIMHVDHDDLVHFAEMVEQELDTINQALRAEDFAASSPEQQNLLRTRLNQVFRCVHNIKGNAVYLKLDYFQKAAEAFETRLSELMARPKLGGDDFLAIVVAQSAMRADLGDLIELRGKLADMRPGASAGASAGSDTSTAAPESAAAPLVGRLRELAREISADLGKEAELHIDDYALHVVARGRHELVRDTLIQLVRNALAHGVETPDARLAAGKPRAARLELAGLPRSADGLVGIALRDDGAGLDLERIRHRALAAGLVPPRRRPRRHRPLHLLPRLQHPRPLRRPRRPRPGHGHRQDPRGGRGRRPHRGPLRPRSLLRVRPLPARDPRDRPRMKDLSPMKLLVVDDSLVVRRTVERNLKLSRFKEIRMASNGLEAITVFEEFQPDVVTLDITMPEMDGLTTVEILRQKNRTAIILIISALADRSTAVEAMKRGAHGFLLKPVTPDSLHLAIQDLLEN